MPLRMQMCALPAMLATALFASAACADPLPIGDPRKVGLSADGLQRLTGMLKAEVDANRLPGMVVAISRKGQLAYFEAIGYADPAAKKPMPRDAIFSIASMTKPMVSIAVMMLHDEGKLLLSDPVAKHLPQLANRMIGVVKGSGDTAAVDTIPAKRQPTIQDLLRHTSGFTYGGRGETPVHKLWPASSSSSAATYTAPEFLDALSKAPLLYEPGTKWDYSLSVDVLGLVVEAVSGKPLAAFLEERLWKPLGMVDTSFAVPDAKRGRYASGFANDPLTNKPQSVPHASGTPLKFDCGGGCAVSTVTDYMRFAQMLANGGVLDGHRIIARKTLEMMTSDQLGPQVRANTTSPVLPEGYTFGLGFAIRQHPGIASYAGSAGDYTWGGAYGTNFWVDPKEEMAVVYMAVTPGDIRVHYRSLMRNLVLQSIAD